MTHGDVRTRLHGFTRSLLEWRGGLVDWAEDGDQGEAVLPQEVAEALRCPESPTLSYEPGHADLAVNLATDFIDRTAALFRTETRIGAFQIPDLYLKQSPMEGPLARAFIWHNARVKIQETHRARIEYHTWHFHAALQSDDLWEDVFSLTLNAESQAEVGLPDLSAVATFEPNLEPAPDPPDTYAQAARRALHHLDTRAEGFMTRLESKLTRDRRRLKDYYQALTREAKAKMAKSKSEEDAQQQRDLIRAVDLELRRKLLELDDRYAVKGQITPLILIRTDLPVLAIDCDVFRKQARRKHTIYWNPLLKEIEPLCCHQCGACTFSVSFTDDEVAPTCPGCA